jgi:hypothetical protein
MITAEVGEDEGSERERLGLCVDRQQQ